VIWAPALAVHSKSLKVAFLIPGGAVATV